MDADSLAEALISDLAQDRTAILLGRQALERAMQTWPALPPPDYLFVEFVRERLPARELRGGSVDPEAEANLSVLDGVDISELLLVYHAIAGHAGAIAEVKARMEITRSSLRRTGASGAEVDDLLQDLVADLVAPRATAAPRIAGYAGRSSLTSWIRVVAVRMMVERRRKRGEVLTDDDFAEEAAVALGPEAALLQRTYVHEFRKAFASAVSELTAADRAMLRQHYLDGVSLDALARLYSQHRSTIARKLAASREFIFEQVRVCLLRDLKVGGDTVNSILRLVQNDMDISLVRYL
jgi:RNA polymerase sigma-70 factor, ECF subfamily